MLLENKIINKVKELFNVNCIKGENFISFIYKENNYSINQIGLFNYTLSINTVFVFLGNYFQLIGFFKGIKADKPEKLVLSSPTPIMIQINDALKKTIYDDKKIKDLNKKIASLQESNNQLNAKKVAATNSIKNYKKEITGFNTILQQKNKEIKEKDNEILQLKNDCEEAALLISDLYYKSSEIEAGTKKYKLDHFPKDVQKFIKEIIDEYYNK